MQRAKKRSCFCKPFDIQTEFREAFLARDCASFGRFRYLHWITLSQRKFWKGVGLRLSWFWKDRWSLPVVKICSATKMDKRWNLHRTRFHQNCDVGSELGCRWHWEVCCDIWGTRWRSRSPRSSNMVEQKPRGLRGQSPNPCDLLSSYNIGSYT